MSGRTYDRALLFICLSVCRHSAPSAGHITSRSCSRSCRVFWNSYMERRTGYITAYKTSECVSLILTENLCYKISTTHKIRLQNTCCSHLRNSHIPHVELKNTKMVCPHMSNRSYKISRIKILQAVSVMAASVATTGHSHLDALCETCLAPVAVIPCIYIILRGFGSLEVACLAFGTQVRGFKPGRSPHCIYVFCIYLRTNSHLCHLYHKLIGFYNRDEKCLLGGTNLVF